jgi:hypothetical protein
MKKVETKLEPSTPFLRPLIIQNTFFIVKKDFGLKLESTTGKIF